MHLASPDNPLAKRLTALHTATGRRETGLCLVEGRRAIEGCLAAGWRPAHLLLRENIVIPDGWSMATIISERVAAKISAASTPSGYLAAFPIPDHGPVEVRAGGLVLVGVSDPGNVGTLIRTAAAFAVNQVVISGGADPYAPKAVQASAGAIAAVRVHRIASPAGVAGGAALCALVPRGGSAPAGLPAGNRWLVVGGEAEGIPDDWLAACAERLTLPMPGAAVESLNAAVAGAVAMYALSRPAP